MSSLRSFAVPVLAALAFLFASVTDARAQFPTLEGEIFDTSDRTTSRVTCDPGGIIRFHVEGAAVGPQPGAFVEDGEITFDPATSRITNLTIRFTITALGSKPVTGGKDLKDGTASCLVDKSSGVTTFTVRAPVLLYRADIGGIADSGVAVLDLSGRVDDRGQLMVIRFTEVFNSSNLTPAFGKVTGGGSLLEGDKGTGGVTFGFNAQNTNQGMKGSGVIIDHNLGTKVKILDVTWFGISGAHATFMGQAEVNNVVEKYRIDVDDVGEPGTGSDTIRIITDSYGTGGTLTSGNIQVHN